MLCRRLMEKRLSAVIDLSELPADSKKRETLIGQQRLYVRGFLDELGALPRKLWRATVIVLDEAHLFAPEKGHGDAESTASVINAATLGRKRAYCTLLATQRISKLNKDAAAEQLNRFFGGTTLDIDVERCAKDLGMTPKDARALLRELKPGEFYAFGPALSEHGVVRFHAATARTTHPEPGEGRTLRPPKPSKAIAAVLSEFTDLPQEAEQEIHDLAAAKSRIAELERNLRRRPKEQVTRERTVQVSSKRDQQTIARLRAGLEQAMKVIAQVEAKGFDKTPITDAEVTKALNAAKDQIVKLVAQKIERKYAEFEKFKTEARRALNQLQKLLDADVSVSLSVKRNEPFTVTPAPAPEKDGDADGSVEDRLPAADEAARAELSLPQRRVLDSLAYWEVVGVAEPSNTAVAFMANYSINTGSYKNACRELRETGCMTEARQLTERGRELARFPKSAGSLARLHNQFLKVLDTASARVLKVLIDTYPDAIDNETLASKSGYSVNTGSYKNARRALRNFGLAEDRGDGLAATTVVFPEQLC
jgi:hypothetical protein